jgi:Family of unknown function (DUF5691)
MSQHIFDDPFSADIHARIRQAFLLGIARQPLAVPPSLAPIVGQLGPAPEPVLALLALTGQRQRFVRPQHPAVEAVSDAARRLHEDPRPILPPLARRSLSRLTRSVEKANAGSIVAIAVRRIGEAGCRVHPFDLPDVARHIKSDAASLGLAERAYLALAGNDGDEESAKGVFYERITADNWTTFPKAHRRAFVGELRRKDTAAGRALVETVWKSEPAPVRAVLLEALAIGLGEGDKPFLDGLATDRAESVKQAAAQLLTRISSTDDFKQRLGAAAKCFAKAGSGLGKVMAAFGIGGEATLTFQLPGDGKNWSEQQAARERLFAGLSLDLLAEAVGDAPDAIIAALPADEHHVLMLLLDRAVADGDMTTARRIVGARLLSSSSLSSHVVMQLADKARVTLDEAQARRFLAAPGWSDTVRAFEAATTPSALKDDGRLVFAATLMPRETLPAFVDTLSPLLPGAARAARDYADLNLALPPAPI